MATATRSVILPSVTRKPRRQRVPVLVVLNPDGHVEVYADDHVSPVIVNRLDSVADAVLIDRFLESQLPRSHRPLHLPQNLRAIANLERRTTADELDRLERLATLRNIQGRRQQ